MSDVAQSAETGECDPLEDWEILTEVILGLVSRPAAVRVEQQARPEGMCFIIHVAPEDLGKVIGKSGETVSILRKLFGRIAASRGRKIFIEIHEPARTSGCRRNVAA